MGIKSKIGPCDICSEKGRIHVDMKGPHVRGHLCSRCISLLALAEDDRHALAHAAVYLLKHEPPDGG